MHKKPRRGAEDEFDYRDVSCVEPMLLSDVDRHMVDAVKHWLETASIERLFEEIVKMDLEGIVAKHAGGRYTPEATSCPRPPASLRVGFANSAGRRNAPDTAAECGRMRASRIRYRSVDHPNHRFRRRGCAPRAPGMCHRRVPPQSIRWPRWARSPPRTLPS